MVDAAAQPSPQDGVTEAVRRLAADYNDAGAQTALFHLCLPEAKARGLRGGTLDRLIAAHPQVIGLRMVGATLARTVDDRVQRLAHLEALYRFGARDELFLKEYGLMLKDNGHYARCLALCGEALALYPCSAGLRRLRAQMHSTLGRHGDALAEWSSIAAADPQDHHARSTVGTIKLLMSDGRDGYADYAAEGDYAIARDKLAVGLPRWRGEALKGKRLLLCANQGIGDIVMFASLLPWVLAQGAEVTLTLYPKLIPLFARSFPGLRIVAHDDGVLTRYAGECEAYAFLGQLMEYVLPHYTPAQHPPFLKADETRAAALRGAYRVQAGAKKLVGISWETINTDTFSQRNIPLAQWAPLLALPHIQYVSLQYGGHAAEIEAVQRSFPGALIVDASIDAFGDTDALAAQIAAMDEVVSIQNATVHLAGALGVKTTLMLSAASDWRWGLERTDSRWYKSVIIERQEKLMEWGPVLKRAAARLEGI